MEWETVEKRESGVVEMEEKRMKDRKRQRRKEKDEGGEEDG